MKEIVAEMLSAIGVLSRNPNPIDLIGKKMYPRSGSRLKRPGKIISTTRCTMEGCPSFRVRVRWPKGNLTCPCLKACKERPDGDWQIGTEAETDGPVEPPERRTP